MRPSFTLLFALLAGLLLGGCSRSTVRMNFQSPEFSLKDLRNAPTLLVVAPNVRVTAYKKSYEKIFPNPEALAVRISKKILDSLKLDSVISANALPDSTLPNAISRAGAKYVIYVHGVTIGDTLTEIPDVLLPSIGGMAPSGGGSSESCIAIFEVEILDSKLAQLYAFTVRTKADVTLYAYKTAILKAVDAASRKAGAHLSGR